MAVEFKKSSNPLARLGLDSLGPLRSASAVVDSNGTTESLSSGRGMCAAAAAWELADANARSCHTSMPCDY